MPETEQKDLPLAVEETTKGKEDKQPEIAPEDKESKLEAGEEPEKEVPAKNAIKFDDEHSDEAPPAEQQEAEQKLAEAAEEKAEETHADKAE